MNDVYDKDRQRVPWPWIAARYLGVYLFIAFAVVFPMQMHSLTVHQVLRMLLFVNLFAPVPVVILYMLELGFFPEARRRGWIIAGSMTLACWLAVALFLEPRLVPRSELACNIVLSALKEMEDGGWAAKVTNEDNADVDVIEIMKMANKADREGVGFFTYRGLYFCRILEPINTNGSMPYLRAGGLRQEVYGDGSLYIVLPDGQVRMAFLEKGEFEDGKMPWVVGEIVISLLGRDNPGSRK